MCDKLVVSFFVLFLCFFNIAHSAYANDSAAGLAATGIYFKDEKNISIEEEVLYINANKVEVSYIFKNHSAQDISTEVAFPMPDYEWDISGNTAYPMYDDFTVVVNGAQIEYQEEIRAFVKDKDYTKLLNSAGISIRDFADFDSYFFRPGRLDTSNKPPYYYEKLTPYQQQILLKNKLVLLDETDAGKLAVPNWRVLRKYYWKQFFPAKKTISIKHSYKPYKGYDYLGGSKPISDACINSDLKQRLVNSPPGPRNFNYVDYILTTANNWKQPIKSFHLIIDGHGSKYNQEPSMCFDKKLEKTDLFHYEVTVLNFEPKKDITVYFFY